MKTFRFRTLVAFLVATSCFAFAAKADVAEYYIGIDARSTPFNAPGTLGGGAYPDAPNHNRLTLLYQHGNHYHGVGTHAWSGPAATSTLSDTNSNNRLPETYTGQLPLPLMPGAGAYAGKNVTQHILGVNYSDLEIRSVHSLDKTVTDPRGAEEVLFNSSSGRWNQPFDTAHIHLELLNVSSPLLNVGTPTDPSALAVGGDVHVGDGDERFSFTTVLWVDATAPVGNYWAEFKLVDESGTYGDSGRFFIDVRQVPEPTSLGLGVLATAAIAAVRRHRRA